MDLWFCSVSSILDNCYKEAVAIWYKVVAMDCKAFVIHCNGLNYVVLTLYVTVTLQRLVGLCVNWVKLACKAWFKVVIAL